MAVVAEGDRVPAAAVWIPLIVAMAILAMSYAIRPGAGAGRDPRAAARPTVVAVGENLLNDGVEVADGGVSRDVLATEDRERMAFVMMERAAWDRVHGVFRGFAELVCRPAEAGPRSAAYPEPLAGARWHRYADDALAPLVVSIASWREDLARGERVAIEVGLLNETGRAQSVDLRTHAVLGDGVLAESSTMQRLVIPAFARTTASFVLDVPAADEFLLVAEMKPQDPAHRTVRSRRKVGYVSPGAAIPDPPFGSGCCRAPR